MYEDLNEIMYECYAVAKEKGFWEEDDMLMNESNYLATQFVVSDDVAKNYLAQTILSKKIMLVVSELGEAIEALRKGKRSAPLNIVNANDLQVFEKSVKDTFEDEIADAVIRLLDICGKMDIPIVEHIHYKLKYNKSRPKMHGKKF